MGEKRGTVGCHQHNSGKRIHDLQSLVIKYILQTEVALILSLKGHRFQGSGSTERLSHCEEGHLSGVTNLKPD